MAASSSDRTAISDARSSAHEDSPGLSTAKASEGCRSGSNPGTDSSSAAVGACHVQRRLAARPRANETLFFWVTAASVWVEVVRPVPAISRSIESLDELNSESYRPTPNWHREEHNNWSFPVPEPVMGVEATGWPLRGEGSGCGEKPAAGRRRRSHRPPYSKDTAVPKRHCCTRKTRR
jgi:hypothetical protein